MHAVALHGRPVPERGFHIAPFLSFCRRNAVFLIAFCAVAVTSVLVPPDRAYLGYFDFSTLTCLFSTLAVINALKNHRFFTVLAEKIVSVTGNLRRCVLSLVYITFIGSMMMANDMALLTFLPLGCYVLCTTDNRRAMALTFILQNAAANLGGMLTPFGNPQNLYLYSRFSIPTADFFLTMLPPFLLSMTLITVACFLFFPKKEIKIVSPVRQKLPAVRTALYLALFVLVILSVFRLLPYYIAGVSVLIVLLVFDRNALKKVDYPLLLTFVCFFIFAGNMVRIEAVRNLLSGVLASFPLLVSVLSCQVISNVPSAILLSGFTEAWKPLLLGVNIGGVGTLISSLASLITFRTYLTENRGGTARYLLLFSAVNFTMLSLLFLLCAFL